MVRILFGFWLILFLWLASVGEAAMKTISLSWDTNTEPNLAGYRLYWGQTYASAANKTGTMVEIGNKTSVCVQVDDSVPVYFFGVTAYNTSGNESTATVGYLLFGNIAGTYNDGTPYTSARVDGFDLTTLGLYFGQSVSHPTYNCSGTFVIQLPTDAQKSDLNKDGRVDGFDLIELGIRFGNAAYP